MLQDGVRNVTSHTISLFLCDEGTSVSTILPIIKRFTEIPAKRSVIFQVMKDNIESFAIRIMEGESTVPEECVKLGEVVVRNLPPGLPKGTKVEVTFEFDKSSILYASVKCSGKEGKAEIKVEGGLTEEQLKEEGKHIKNA